MLRDELNVGRQVRRWCLRNRLVCQTCSLELQSSLYDVLKPVLSCFKKFLCCLFFTFNCNFFMSSGTLMFRFSAYSIFDDVLEIND